MKACIIATETKTRDVMRDRLGRNSQRNSQKAYERDGGQNQSVFAGIAAQLRADHNLKDIMNDKRQKTDDGVNDPARQQISSA